MTLLSTSSAFGLVYRLICLGLGLSLLLSLSAQAQPIRYVKQGSNGDGRSWANASGDLQGMIDAPGVEQVFVAQGTYKPGGPTNRDQTVSFAMKNGVSILGGFPPTGDPSLSERNPASFTTVLSGDIDNDNALTNNSYHVLFHPASLSLTTTAVLDGFVITGGNATGGGYNSGGGGIYNESSSPSLINCSFAGNQATNNSKYSGGGAIYNSNSSPSLINCSFVDNQANYNNVGSVCGGGAIYNSNSNPSLINCTFVNNQANNNSNFAGGGAIYNYFSSPSLTNCTLANNQANNNGAFSGGGAIYNSDNSSSLTNCVVWGNGTGNIFYQLDADPIRVRYSLLDASVNPADYTTSGPGNRTTTSSPFVSDVDLRLNTCSIAINAGDNTANSTTTDLAGTPRIVGSRIDVGAYEYQAAPSQPVAITQSPVSGTSVPSGASVTASVSVTGTASSYQWYKDGASLGAAQQQPTLTLSPVQLSDTGNYWVVVTGTCNSLTSTAFSLSVNQSIRYVKQEGTGDGNSWANASGDLQAMIDAPDVEQVFVAAGRYQPAANASFVMKDGVGIYGGFVGLASEQGPTNRPSVNPISGQPSSSTLAGNGGSVIKNQSNGLTNSAVLDGFVITGGQTGAGGGMYNDGSSPTLFNCVFGGNSATDGGGMYNTDSSPLLFNCVFESNSASGNGGGIYNYYGNSTFFNCVFGGNSATNDGGGIYNFVSSPLITNGVFLTNSATNEGGGIYNRESSNPRFVNCSLLGNSSSGGGRAIHSYSNSNPVLTNCVVWNTGGATTFVNTYESTVTATYSLFDPLVTDYSIDPSNLTATRFPFVSQTDLRLNACSVAINSGDPASTTATSGATDLAGLPRLVGDRIDLGAYEYQATPARLLAGASLPMANLGVVLSLTATTGTAPGTTSFQWSAPATAPLTSPATASAVSTSLTTAGVQTFTVVATTGQCSQTALVSVTALAGPDLSATLSLPDANFPPGSSKNLLMQVQEVNGSATMGTIVITISVPTGYSVSFSSSLTSIQVSGGSTTPVAVQNSQWRVSNSVAGQQLSLALKPGESVEAHGVLTVGLSVSRTSANSGSSSNITVNVSDDSSGSYDVNRLNNIYARIINGL